MNEFRKPYEYEEETGLSGVLLLFFLSLISADLICAVILFSQGAIVISAETDMLLPLQASWGVYLLLKLAFAVSLFFKKPFVVTFAHSFLAMRAVLFCATAVATASLVLANFEARHVLSFSMVSRWQITYMLLILPIVYSLVYSLGWSLYFMRSRKVKEFYRVASETAAS